MRNVRILLVLFMIIEDSQSVDSTVYIAKVSQSEGSVVLLLKPRLRRVFVMVLLSCLQRVFVLRLPPCPQRVFVLRFLLCLQQAVVLCLPLCL